MMEMGKKMKMTMLSCASAFVCGIVCAVTPEELVDCPVSENLRGHENTEWSISYAYHLTDGQKALPRVLLVGDSICNAYQSGVCSALEGKMAVTYWVSSYCVTSPCYMKLLSIYLDEAEYAVVHFNNGCHSLSTLNEDWEKGFRAALDLIRLKQPKARIIWTTTTPNKDASKTAKIVELNAIAAKVVSGMKDVAVDDLFSLMNPLDRETFWQDNYHFKAAAVGMQVSQVTDACRKAQENANPEMTSSVAGLASVNRAIHLSGVSFEQDESSRDVVVNYTLTGTNAIIRAAVLTNGVSIGKTELNTFVGDYSMSMADVVSPGTHTFRWKARKDWPDRQASDLQVKVCALYADESGNPEIYDEFARPVFSSDFSVTSLEGWTTGFARQGAGAFATVQRGQLVVCDGLSISPNTWAMVCTPVFEGLTYWRVSFDLGILCADFTDWDQYWTRWRYSISGLDAEDSEVFKLVGQADARGTGTSSTIGGVRIPGSGKKTHLILLRNSKNAFSVFGPDGVAGTTTAVIGDPDAKLAKLKFVIPEPVVSPATCGYGFIDNVRVEDISSAPF